MYSCIALYYIMFMRSWCGHQRACVWLPCITSQASCHVKLRHATSRRASHRITSRRITQVMPAQDKVRGPLGVGRCTARSSELGPALTGAGALAHSAEHRIRGVRGMHVQVASGTPAGDPGTRRQHGRGVRRRAGQCGSEHRAERGSSRNTRAAKRKRWRWENGAMPPDTGGGDVTALGTGPTPLTSSELGSGFRRLRWGSRRYHPLPFGREKNNNPN